MLRALRLVFLAAAALTTTAALGAAQPRPGALDRSFGTQGLVTTDFGVTRAAVSALAIQPDGEIIAAGTSLTPDEGSFALARYRPDGSLDTSFGTRGTVTTPVAAYVTAGAVLLLPDGKILVAGTAFEYIAPDAVSPDGLAVARYLPDGSLDPTFGSHGLASPRFERVNAVNDAVLQPDGKIVLGGRGSVPEHTYSTGFGLVRLNSDGSPDLSFGIDGEVTDDFNQGGVTDVTALALQSDGRIVAVGVRTHYPTLEVAFARYATDGTLEPGFGSAGPSPALYGFAQDVALQPDGKILLAGGDISSDGGNDVLLVRMLPGGSVDPSFRGPAGALAGSARTVALQPDGKIVLGGGPAAGFAVARFTSSGTLDPTFGTGGLAQKPVTADALAVQPDSKIVVAGNRYRDADDWDFGVARFLGKGIYCLVPAVVGRTRVQASREISRAHCRIGEVSTRRSSVPRGRVLAQSPKPKTELGAGAPVRLVVSRGRRG